RVRRGLPRRREEECRYRPGVVPAGPRQGRERLQASPVDDQGRAEGRADLRDLSRAASGHELDRDGSPGWRTAAGPGQSCAEAVIVLKRTRATAPVQTDRGLFLRSSDTFCYA